MKRELNINDTVRIGFVGITGKVIRVTKLRNFYNMNVMYLTVKVLSSTHVIPVGSTQSLYVEDVDVNII